MFSEILVSGSTGNSYLLKDSSTSILLDIGVPLKVLKRKLNHSLHSVSAAFITHEHF